MAPDYLYFPSLPSTHDYAIELVTKTKPLPFTAIVAGHQTAGRGRFDRSWSSAPDENALFSVIVYPQQLAIHEAFLLNMCATLATVDVLKARNIPKITIKWPNDILIDQQKICGTLIQNQLSGSHISSSVISAGINVNQREWKAPIRATSIADVLDMKQDVTLVIQDWIHHLMRYIELINCQSTATIATQWLTHLIGYNEAGHFQDKDGNVFIGTIRGIDTNGKLRVERDQGIHLYFMDELRQLL